MLAVLKYEISKILEQERDRIFLWFPVVFALGIATYFSINVEPSLWCSLIVIETLIVLAYLWRAKPVRLSLLGWLSVFVLGFINIQVRAYYINSIPLLSNEETIYLKAYVDAKGYNYRGKLYFVFSDMKDFDDNSIQGKYKVTALHGNQDIDVGDCVETVAQMRPLMLPNMHNSYQFNRKLFFEGIKATGFTDVTINKISCDDIGVKPSIWMPKIYKLREKIVDNIYSVLPDSTAGIASAIIAGERGKISVEQNKEYRDSGLAHFLSISGLHMSMLAGLMFFVVRWLFTFFPKFTIKHDTKKIAAVFAIIMSFIYLIISGWQISTQRAFIMSTLVLIGVLVGRKAISMRMIAWAVWVILIFEPSMLISAGFQMSFAAVIMLVSFYEKFAGKMQNWWQESRYDSKILKFIKMILVYLVGIVVADMIASMATLPFAIYHFNRISVYTSIANFLAGPVISLWIMPGVLISLLLMPLGLDKYILLFTGKGIAIVNDIVHWVAGLEGASYQILSMPSWGFMLIVFGGLWLALWQSRWRHLGWIGIILGFLSIAMVQKPDVLTDNDAKTFAVKDNQGKMVILPNRGNYFTKQMWIEKLAQKKLSNKDKRKLSAIYKGKAEDIAWIDLVCDNDKCIYKNKVIIYKKGGININSKDYSKEGALSVYDIDKGIKTVIVKEVLGNRYWNRV